MEAKILFFNPRSAKHKPRIPNSILQVAASVDGKHEWIFVDGNRETDPWSRIESYLLSAQVKYFACTVMPGPQLKQAIPFSKKIREQFPSVKIIWGGYFPSNQSECVLNSGYVDVIVNGMGDKSFPMILSAFENTLLLDEIPNIIFKKGNDIVKTKKDPIYELDELPVFPYEKLNGFYSLTGYLGRTYLGTKTIAYHSSFGCPFTCSFCAVVPIYNARWKGMSAQRIYRDVKYFKENFGGNAIEFHDNNFFVSEKRSVEFAKLVKDDGMTWWGEARIDTMDKYSDESLALLRESGCRMIFFGAETGNDEILKRMDKGGTQNAAQILRFAERLRKFDIIPEYSFVLGTPAETEQEVNKQIDDDIAFIKKVKSANPNAEIIIYVYSPVAVEGSELYTQVKKSGFSFPSRLEDWISPEWESFDLRKNPLTPWLKPYMVDKIKNFETVLHGYFPTVSDIRLNKTQRGFLRLYSSIRYKYGIYKAPLGIKVLHKVLKYRKPETEGF